VSKIIVNSKNIDFAENYVYMTPPYGSRGDGGSQAARDSTPRWMQSLPQDGKMENDFTPR
jgi:hypothetical protein